MKKLYLSKDKKISGVCGGIAEALDMDPTIIRIATVFLLLVTGIFPVGVLYIIAAFVVPERPSGQTDSTVHDVPPTAPPSSGPISE